MIFVLLYILLFAEVVSGQIVSGVVLDSATKSRWFMYTLGFCGWGFQE